MMASSCDEILSLIQRDVNILGEEATADRNIKKKALEKIKKATETADTETLTLLFKVVLKPLLKCFSDPVEKCREMAICTTFEQVF